MTSLLLSNFAFANYSSLPLFIYRLKIPTFKLCVLIIVKTSRLFPTCIYDLSFGNLKITLLYQQIKAYQGWLISLNLDTFDISRLFQGQLKTREQGNYGGDFAIEKIYYAGYTA
jgi:hypothetical protein